MIFTVYPWIFGVLFALIVKRAGRKDAIRYAYRIFTYTLAATICMDPVYRAVSMRSLPNEILSRCIVHIVNKDHQ